MDLKANMRKIYYMQLAIESYLDDNNKIIPIVEEIFDELKDLRTQNYDELKALEKSNVLIKKFDKAFDTIGRDKFVFYDDDDINYIWKDSKNGKR